MKAMILAAGRGTRMRPLTDRTPKPLLEVNGRALIEWHLLALAAAGVREVVINTAWLEDRIVERLGDGSRHGVSIAYSMEGRDHGGALETAGGVATALPLLGRRDAPIDHPAAYAIGASGAEPAGDAFWLVSADVYAPDFRFDADDAARFAATGRLAHLWLVPNPPFHPAGDFGLGADGLALADGTGLDGRRWTYANIALCRPALCAGVAPGTHAKLAPLLYAGMRERRIGAEVHRGRWENVGTPEQLERLNRGDPSRD